MNTIIHYAGMDIHTSNTVIQTIAPNGAQVQQREVPGIILLMGYSPDCSVGDKPEMVLDGRFIEADHQLD